MSEVATINPETLGSGTERDLEFEYIDLSSVSQGRIRWPSVTAQVFKTAPSRARRIVRQGDILFGNVRPDNRSHGYIPPHPSYLVASTGFTVLRAISGIAEPRFLFHYVLSDDIAAQARKVEVGSGYPAVNESDVERFEVPAASLPEQRRIAEILDTLDEAIRKTEQVIAKLQQMKQGLLHDLLTRGIDDNGEVRDQERHPEQFKDTQLGWIPKGWDAVPASTLLLGVEQGWSPDCEAEPAEKGSWGVLKTTAVTWSRYDDSANKALPGHLRPRPEYEVKANDVLMTRAGPNSRVGVVALVTETQGRLMLSDKMYRLLPNTEKVSPEYLALALSGEKTQRHLATLKTGLAESQTNISQSIVLSLWIPLPGLAEQDRICDRHASLSRQAQLEALVLAKLLVLKKGLMNDLLTGRVRATINEEVGAA